jgi:Protein of unknown function (DUF3027)
MTSESAEATPDAATAPGAGGASARKTVSAKNEPKTPAAKPRTGVPVWRTGKPDAFLAAAVEFARDAVATIANPGEIGPHIGAKSEGERVVTHLFESRIPGYGGWQWYAVVTRNSRSKVVTVSELGLLPSEDSILAPEWIPWAKRVRPEDETPASEEVASEETSEEADEAPEASDEAAVAGSDDDAAGSEGSGAEEDGPEETGAG